MEQSAWCGFFGAPVRRHCAKPATKRSFDFIGLLRLVANIAFAKASDSLIPIRRWELGAMESGKAGPNSAKWKPGKPLRIAILAGLAALFLGLGIYGLAQGKLVLPYRPLLSKPWNARNIYLNFEGGSAQLISVGFLLLAAGVMIFMLQLIRAEPGTKIDKTLYAVLVLAGGILVVALYVLKVDQAI